MTPQTEKQTQRQAQKEQRQQKLLHELQLKQVEQQKEIRENVRNMFTRIFTNYLDASDKSVDFDPIKAGKHIEKHIFNFTVFYAKSNEIRPVTWTNLLLQRLYKERSRDLLCNLNPNGYVGNKTLIKRLIDDKEFDLKHLVHEMVSHRDLMPERYVEYDEEIRLERELIENYVEEIYDGAFKCGRCKSTKTKHYMQMRASGDEAATSIITCLNCARIWKQRT